MQMRYFIRSHLFSKKSAYYAVVLISLFLGMFFSAVNILKAESLNIPPVVQTLAASNVIGSAAALNAQVNPNGSATYYWFEYGTSISLNNSTGAQFAGEGSTSLTVSASVSGLMSNTLYYFRIVAQNQFGTVQGVVVNFTTGVSGSGTSGLAPSAQTLSASNITESSAALNAQVNPNGRDTIYWFEYGASTAFGNTTLSQSAGAGTAQFNVSASASALSSGTQYYFRIVAQNQYGTFYGTTLNFSTTGTSYPDYNYPSYYTPPSYNYYSPYYYGNQNYNYNQYGLGAPPSVFTQTATNVKTDGAVLNGQVNPSGSDTYVWFEYGTAPGTLTYNTNQSYSNNSFFTMNFSQTVTGLSGQGATYYFRAAARNSWGTSYGQVSSFSVSSPTTNVVGQKPIAITKTATLVSQNSSLLNGEVNPNGGTTSAWFEYGQTPALGLKTNAQAAGSGAVLTPFSSTVFGLIPNSTYYFRVVAQNQYGVNYGVVSSFQTVTPAVTGTVATRPAVVQVAKAETRPDSCLALVPSLNMPVLNSGEEFTYTATYKNICAETLSNAFLKIILPTEAEFVSTSHPFSTRDANGVSYNLGSLASDSQGAINIRGRVASSAGEGSTVIFSAVLNFNDGQNRFQSVSAYVNAVIGTGKTLTASVFDTFKNLMGNWMFDLLLIAGVAFLLYWIFFKRGEGEEKVDVLKI